MTKPRILVLIAFVLVAGLVWLPFHTMTTLKETRWTEPKPAGEIRGPFVLDQQVHLPSGIGKSDRDYCFGIRFATYQRRNSGRVVVEWTQQGQRQRWSVRAGSLVDNKFRYFCPDVPDDAALAPSFGVRISGVDGRPGKSPTLWLVEDESLGTARLNGESTGKGIALDLTERRRTGITDMVRAANGAFLVGWVCTLVIGIVALLYILRGKSTPLDRLQRSGR